MSDRELRKSTQKASKETKNRLEARKSVRELKQQRSTYRELIANEEREISELADASDTQGASEIVMKVLTRSLVLKKIALQKSTLIL